MEIGKSKYEVIYWKSTADIDEEENYEAEVVDLSVDKEALTRRGKRVFAGIKNRII